MRANILRLAAVAAFSGWAAAQTAAQQPVPAAPTVPGAQQPATPQAPATPGLKPGYAGTEACKACHEEIANSFAKSPHSTVETNKSRGWAAMACESCHGPGAKHAESGEAKDIRLLSKLSPPEADRACLACHLNNTTHFGRIMAGHAKETVSCVQCHSVHGAGGWKLVERKPADINAQCAS